MKRWNMSYLHLIILCVFLIISSSCDKNPTKPVADKDYTNDFEFIWSTVDQYYPFLQLKKINWDSIYSVYSPQVKNVNNSEIRTIFNNLILELKDGHASLIDENGNTIPPGYLPRRYIKDAQSFDFALVEQFFDKDNTVLL